MILCKLGGPDQNLKAPGSLQHRYVIEEINHGLVPIASIGKRFNVLTPNIDALIRLGSTTSGMDFLKDGLTCEKLGIARFTFEELNCFLATDSIARNKARAPSSASFEWKIR